jgi:ABC-type antimicrobial peptide transport system ATPase subunit
VFPVLNDWIHAAHSLTKTSTTVVHELREIGWRSKQKTRRLLAHGRTQHSEHQFRKSTPLELTAGECRKYLKHIRFYAVYNKSSVIEVRFTRGSESPTATCSSAQTTAA